MADSTVGGLTAVATPALTDITNVRQSGDTRDKKETLAQVRDVVQDNLDDVTVTGGSISGITDLAVADGGTGASDASGARTNLGLAIGSDVQAYDAGLDSISGLTTAADRMIYTTASDTYAVATLTSAGRAILDDADASAQRTTLGLAIGTDVQAYDADTAKTDVAQEYTATQNFNATTLSDGANISWDASANQVASVTLGGNRTLDNPTNMVDGGTYILRVVQDATGSRTLSYGTAYKWPGGTAPTLTTDANAVDILTFVSDGTNMYGVAQLDFS